MKIKSFCKLSLAGLLTGCATPIYLDGVAQKELPSATTFACAEHVDDFGGEGRAPASIFWQSYSSSQELASVIRFYRKQFGADPTQDRPGVYHWSLGDGLRYSVYSLEAGARWLNCGKTAPNSKTVLMISKFSSAKPR
ncbi:hypothetical protein [Massilia sp. erpn]|uniref:hypothetical protein n=1 Tax=Massilia sp. erpn TaxID=2738142 RepID=UPI002106FC01|nr:hypothetical protein [Massilia sp. erpn]UTY59840.1 hypothetical protein HPQ68_23235 [Massilia sp. erpn]